MEPEINKNDIVILKKVKEKNLSEEDIILFLRNEEDYRMARIRNTRENKGIYSYVVKADNNYYVEEILGETIQGKMIGKISNLAFLLNILRSKILTIIIIIGIILFLRYKQKLKKRKNRRKELNIRKREIET